MLKPTFCGGDEGGVSENTKCVQTNATLRCRRGDVVEVNDRAKFDGGRNVNTNRNNNNISNQLRLGKGSAKCSSSVSGSCSSSECSYTSLPKRDFTSFAANKPKFRNNDNLYVDLSQQCDDYELQNWTTDEDNDNFDT